MNPPPRSKAGPGSDLRASSRSKTMSNARRATIKDIAQAAGLSTAAVSQALRPHPKSNIKLQQETIERVKRVAGELNYQPHAGARSIRSNSFDTIGYFIAKTGLLINSPSGYLAGVHDVAESQGSRITMIRLPADLEDISKAMPSVFSERNLDALVIESYSELAHLIYERVQASGLPVIFLNDRHDTNSVFVDEEWAAGELSRHLIEKGYQRIGFLHRHIKGEPPVEKMHHSAPDRENGYRKAMRQANLPASCHTVTTCGVVGLDVSLSSDDWEMILRHDAVIAYDDDLANLIGRTACENRVAIPGTLAVAGFNGDYASLSAWQRLTTMRIPAYDIGRKAAEMAFELFQNGPEASIPSVAFRPTLIVGRTT